MISRHMSVITGQLKRHELVGTDATVVLKSQCMSCSSLSSWVVNYHVYAYCVYAEQ